MDFGDFQPCCLHLRNPESVECPGPDRYTVCAGFGVSPKRASQRPESPGHHTPFTQLPQPPAATKKPSRPASNHPCLRTPPPPQFRPPHARGQPYKPNPYRSTHTKAPRRDCQPSRGKHTTWLDLTRCNRLPRWPHSTPNDSGHRTVHTTPRPADLPPHPSTRRPRIQPHPPSSVKTSLVPTTYTTSMEKPSIPENSRKSPMESVQTSLFQRFV